MTPLDALPYEWLGLLALGILWVNTLLIAAAAWQQRSALGAIRATMIAGRHDGTLVSGIVEEGRGPEGAIAMRHVEQMGRALTISGPDRILFTERAVDEEIFGGVVRTDAGETLDVEAARGESIEIWLRDDAPSARRDADFERAWSRASTNKGCVSTLEQRIERGARVWLHRGADGVLRIAALDPVAECTRKRALLAGFAVLTVLSCAVVSLIACWPPALGTISTIGGVLGVAYFLAIQPLGTAVRDAARIPPERLVTGVWQRPA
ncbi:hypothetical protein [Sandaracinus amylolyticus]|uniref:Uncharacterized protein n=1 Tax=Sandaracinus amylolyticus TaxID=927083 RepID=A0A0F6SFQ2_9BACT|nr:hypothetical protein [Sandaracinus amylolyticus]AKF07339.1 hypothetical protein DB32_004488 [Sandaracinus amylolyticus]